MSAYHSTLTHESLVQMLDYDPECGTFRWKVSTNGRALIGAEAGCVSGTTGYRVIRKGKMLMAAHRLAWFYVHGAWPSKDVDHIDGIKTNNAIANLREVCQMENQQNRKKSHRDSSSKILGISLDKRRNLWKAEISVYKVRQFLGYFETPELAGDAYIKAKRLLHPFGTL